MIVEILPVTPFQQNCTLLIAEDGAAAVIDPGGEVARIRSLIEDRGARVDKVLLTHGHLDHVGGARELADALDVPIWGPHSEDAYWLEALPQQAALFGLPNVEPFYPDRWLEEGEQLAVGDLRLDVYHCPGHTPGHVVFVEASQRWAQVGDVLFQGSIGRTDFPRGDHAALLSSISDKLLPLGDDIAFVPGHGPMSTFGEERRHNPFLNDS